MTKNKKKINISKIASNKKFLITVSLLISVVIWFVAMIERNPIRQQVFTDVSVAVSIDNTSAQNLGLGIVSDVTSQKFTVTLSGPNYIISTLKSDDFLLSASVNDVSEPGTYSLSVTGTRNSEKSGYTFVSIEPSSIDVTFDYVDTKDFTVVPKVVGVSATDGLVAEKPIVSNSEQSTITIKGPRGTIEKITSVGALAEVSGGKVLSATQSLEADIVLYGENDKILYRYTTDGIVDGSGNKVDSNMLNLSFTNIKITQPISKKATLDVKVNFSNMPAGITEESLSVKLDHTTASVLGTPSVVDGLTAINLSPIDFREISAKGTGSFEVTPAFPDGVHLADNIEFFVVKIDVSSFAERTFSVSNIKYLGLADGLTVSKTVSIKNVKICGPKDVVNNIKASDLYAEIDLSNQTAGEYTLEATIKSSANNNVWQIGNYVASVTIANK